MRFSRRFYLKMYVWVGMLGVGGWVMFEEEENDASMCACLYRTPLALSHNTPPPSGKIIMNDMTTHSGVICTTDSTHTHTNTHTTMNDTTCPL